MATAVVGATLAEWQRKREEEQARQREADRIAQMEKNAERKAEKARLDYLNAAYQAKLDREKAKQNAVASARWNGIAKIEQAKEKAKQIAVSAARWTGLAQIEQAKEKANVGGGKPLAKPVNHEPLNWWEKLLSTFTPTPSATSTFTPSITPTPSTTPTQTPSPTRTPLPTPTTDNINIAISYLQYSPQGLDLYRELNKKANNVEIRYSDTERGGIVVTNVTKEYLFGLIKVPAKDVLITVNPLRSPTFIAGTIAHESYHFLTPW